MELMTIETIDSERISSEYLSDVGSVNGNVTNIKAATDWRL